MRVWPRISLVAALLALSACGGGTTSVDRSVDETTTSVPTSTEAASPRTINVRVLGRDIEDRCSGEENGEPTVILLHGNGGDQATSLP